MWARHKAQQATMAQGEKMAAMGQLVAGIAHEITNPLASMDSLLQLMQRHPSQPRPQAVDTLREQVERILRIIRQLTAFAMKGSMSRKGDCWDNAVTETLFGSLKVERLHEMRFCSRRRAKDEVLDWLTFYNSKRLHSTLGYMSPMAFEKKRLAEEGKLVA